MCSISLVLFICIVIKKLSNSFP
ncbi:Protein CBG26491 [Caenorhabditis briggsae]|uniref:Protein CBG26491 n=1 Tax=Caenorhabditis briggsae TaxID=6238 RepID=B6IH42_CAEBR|nr:Protein CBG26491 [Caenorhabditis briggsae]CAR99222.1 Protein CBG26491 [Caenorhabditis briggsae]